MVASYPALRRSAERSSKLCCGVSLLQLPLALVALLPLPGPEFKRGQWCLSLVCVGLFGGVREQGTDFLPTLGEGMEVGEQTWVLPIFLVARISFWGVQVSHSFLGKKRSKLGIYPTFFTCAMGCSSSSRPADATVGPEPAGSLRDSLTTHRMNHKKRISIDVPGDSPAGTQLPSPQRSPLGMLRTGTMGTAWSTPVKKGALRDHFLSDEYNDGLDMNPAETQYKLEAQMQTPLYKHPGTGMLIWRRAIELASSRYRSDEATLLFHYTTKGNFNAVCSAAYLTPELWSALKDADGSVRGLTEEPDQLEAKVMEAQESQKTSNSEEVRATSSGLPSDRSKFCLAIKVPKAQGRCFVSP
eukprot:s4520_g4.t1